LSVLKRASTHPETGNDPSTDRQRPILDGQSAVTKWRSARSEMAPTPSPKLSKGAARARSGILPHTLRLPICQMAQAFSQPRSRHGLHCARRPSKEWIFSRAWAISRIRRGPFLTISYDCRNGWQQVAGPFCKRGNAVLKRTLPPHRMARARAEGSFHIPAFTRSGPHPLNSGNGLHGAAPPFQKSDSPTFRRVIVHSQDGPTRTARPFHSSAVTRFTPHP
jgi:hypothetical protein